MIKCRLCGQWRRADSVFTSSPVKAVANSPSNAPWHIFIFVLNFPCCLFELNSAACTKPARVKLLSLGRWFSPPLHAPTTPTSQHHHRECLCRPQAKGNPATLSVSYSNRKPVLTTMALTGTDRSQWKPNPNARLTLSTNKYSWAWAHSGSSKLCVPCLWMFDLIAKILWFGKVGHHAVGARPSKSASVLPGSMLYTWHHMEA